MLHKDMKKSSKPQNFSLPIIIFGETHDDPIVIKVIDTILTKLIEHGYSHFFDEVIKGTSLDQAIEDTDQTILYANTFIEMFKQLNLDITNELDVLAFLTKYYPSISDQIEKDAQNIMDLAAFLPSKLLTGRFYKKIREINDFEFYAMDAEEEYTVSESPKALEVRDKAMVSAILLADTKKGGVLCRIGVGHCMSLHEEISKKHPKLNSNMLYFHIHSGPISKNDNEMLKKIRHGLTHIISIDASCKSMDAIISIIMKKVFENQPVLETTLPKKTSNKKSVSTLFEISLNELVKLSKAKQKSSKSVHALTLEEQERIIFSAPSLPNK